MNLSLSRTSYSPEVGPNIYRFVGDVVAIHSSTFLSFLEVEIFLFCTHLTFFDILITVH